MTWSCQESPGASGSRSAISDSVSTVVSRRVMRTSSMSFGNGTARNVASSASMAMGAHSPYSVLLFNREPRRKTEAVWAELVLSEGRDLHVQVRPQREAGDRLMQEGGQQRPNLIGEADAFGGSGAWGQSAAHPDGALVQVRQEFGTHQAAGQQVTRRCHGAEGRCHNQPAAAHGPSHGRFVAGGQERHQRVAPLFHA